MPNVLSAILLDLDGTLVDSAPQLTEAVNRTLAPLGRRSLALEEVQRMIGHGIPALTRAALAATGGIPEEHATEAVVERVRHIYDTLPAPRIFDGVPDALSHWHGLGLSLVVCTNKPEASARRLLAKLALSAFIAAVAGGDSYAQRKPHPDHLLRPLRALRIDPGCAVMVGDSPTDAEAARQAGIPFLAVSYGYTRPEDGPLDAARTVASFSEVPAAVRQVAAERGLTVPPAASAV